ncbi:hypothetical protein [Stenotrophomonas maltophilia]|jgi:hypothetical protein|uniref:hypothetical protein n=1 Tax=Stenotrophomonas maltophilia TaxID=40324 RepID=UPI00130FA970|nr:hypothetical protein [Stenotrophomonas maltophilia]HEL2981957.1 hypothetical protein [Stenotrophomonas maltophilia]
MKTKEPSYLSMADTALEATFVIVGGIACLAANLTTLYLVSVSAWNGVAINWVLFSLVMGMNVSGLCKTTLMVCGVGEVWADRIDHCVETLCVLAAVAVSTWIYCFQDSSLTNLLVIALIVFQVAVSITVNIWAWWKKPVDFRNKQGA